MIPHIPFLISRTIYICLNKPGIISPKKKIFIFLFIYGFNGNSGKRPLIGITYLKVFNTSNKAMPCIPKNFKLQNNFYKRSPKISLKLKGVKIMSNILK